jgi:hypothetical protein
VSTMPRVTELQIEMPDGSWWSVPARVIAENRARYYAASDSDTTFEKEFDFTLRDADELTDWASNNMNWADVAQHARRVEIPSASVDYQEGWVNGEKRVIREDTA